MKNKVSYEWVVEHVDEHGDIQDTHQVDSYSEALMEGKTYHRKDIALVRDRYNDVVGVIERGYAYVNSKSEISTQFCSGQKVPQRYIDEVDGVRNEIV